MVKERHALGGEGGADPMRKLNGTTAVDIIPRTRI